MTFFVCDACRRHVRRGETACPFCGENAALPRATARFQPTTRLSRAALWAMAAALGSACGGKTSGTGKGSDGPGGPDASHPAAGGGSSNMGYGGSAATGGRIGAGGIVGSGGVVGAGGALVGSGGVSIVAPYGAPPPHGGSGGYAIAPPYGIPPPPPPPPPPGDAGLPGDAGVNCIDLFGGGAHGRCCPFPLPDCSKEADGYPGYGCIPDRQSFCRCTCEEGAWRCGC